MDAEAALRARLRSTDRRTVGVRLNDENRVVLVVPHGPDSEVREYVVVENRCFPVPVKPPTQVASVAGFDAFRGMRDYRP